MNSADRPDDAGSVYITHGDFTAPAPASLIRFRYANDGAISNQLVITSEGNVGIGTSSPLHLLHAITDKVPRTGYFYNTLDTSSTTYGIYAGAFSEGSGGKRGGAFDANGGSGTNMGVRATAIDGSTNIGVYSSATGGTTNWAAHFDNGYVIVDDRIGIGTTTPQHLVHATTSSLDRAGYYYNEKNSSSSKYGIYAGSYGTGTGDNRGGAFEANNGTGTNTGVIGQAFNGSTSIGVYGYASGGTTNWAGYFENGNVYMKNNLGIGTTTPVEKLDLFGGDIQITDTYPRIYMDITGTGNAVIHFQKTGSTKSQIYYNGVSDYLKLHNTTGGDFIAIDNAGIGINTAAPLYDLHFIGNNSNDIAEFYNSNTGTNADVLRAKVNKATPGLSQYFYRCVDGGGGSEGGVRADGSGGILFTSISDRRLKTNIHDFTDALSLLNDIQPRVYEFKNHPNVKHFGFIAQELMAVYPIAVVGDENSDPEIEPMMIDYSRLTPLLAGATKELHQKVKDQQLEIDELKRQLEEIKRLIEAK